MPTQSTSALKHVRFFLASISCKTELTLLASAADEEIAKLICENRLLYTELDQCKADKDFVWALWKQLQEESPDVTQVTATMQKLLILTDSSLKGGRNVDFISQLFP